MAANLAAAFIAAVKSKMNLRRDEDLAAHFGWAKSTIASWRSRGSIPEDQLRTLESFSGLDYTSFIRRLGPTQPIFDWLVELSFLYAFSAAGAGLTEKDRRALIMAVFWRVSTLKGIVADRITVRLGSLDIAEAYGDIFSEALRGKFLDAGEIRDALDFPQSGAVPQKVPQ